MSYIINIWDLHDFCATHGRIFPHYDDNEGHFTKFHCADKMHDDSDIVICSEGQGVQTGNFLGLLTMHGYVVEFNDKSEYLFCTSSELENLKQQSKIEKEKYEKNKRNIDEQSEHPAKPKGIKISAEMQDRRFQSYCICPDYKRKIHQVNIMPGLNNNYLLCEDDCIFPNCPFYQKMLLLEYTHNHMHDYDTWVVEFNKNEPGKH